MKKIFKKTFIIGLVAGGLFGLSTLVFGAVTYKVPTPIALYEDSLQSAITSSATSFTLVRGTDIVGTSLASSTYGFIIDEGSASQEFVLADCVATACTNVIRGVSPITGLTAVTSLQKAHRRGAVVKMTDAPILLILKRLVNGDETWPNIISYISHPTFTSDAQIVDKKYVDDTIIAGAPDASDTVKGISKLSVAPVSSVNPIAVGDNDNRVSPVSLATVTAGQVQALIGTSGTAPSTSNAFVDLADVSNAGVADKIVRLNGTTYPAGNGSAITGVATTAKTYTANGNIAQNETVYMTSANTVKAIYPSGQGTGAAVSTSVGHNQIPKDLPLSTNGMFLHITGGDSGTSNPIYAQVGTINAGETDMSYGSDTAVYTTGNGSRWYDIKSIGTDKFLLVFQADTAGVAAGIKAVVITVSGTTVTVGSVQGIETLGNLNWGNAVAKLDTDKGIIFYKKDSDSKLYSQVITVSGTTITTNTPVNIDTHTSNLRVSADQLSTNNAVIVYNDSGAGTILYGNTISVSGTTPTIAAQQTILTQGGAAAIYNSIRAISSTKILLCYNDGAGAIVDKAANVAISGATMTLSSTLTLSSITGNTYSYGMNIISQTYALISYYTTSTSYELRFLNISGSAPTSISTQTLAVGTTSGIRLGLSIVKVSPWTYFVIANEASAAHSYIVKLTVPSTLRVGLAESAITSAATGSILSRYNTQTLSGITLTPASFYYTDDNGQPTVNSSLTAPLIGISINTTDMLIQ